MHQVTGEITYTPDLGFSGSDSFIYEVRDTNGLGDTATVTIAVANVRETFGPWEQELIDAEQRNTKTRGARDPKQRKT